MTHDPEAPSPVVDPDAVVWSAPEDERDGRPLVLLLHGYGSDEHDLAGLVPHLPPEAVYASLRAPLVAPWPIDGWSWYPLDERGSPDPEAVTDAADAVGSWLDGLGSRHPLVGLAGFSQGGSLVLQLLRRFPSRFAFGVVLAGFVAPGGLEGDAALLESRPPVFWGRGTADTVIAESAVLRTTEWLPSHSTLSGRIYDGLAHGISAEELSDVGAFLSRLL